MKHRCFDCEVELLQIDLYYEKNIIKIDSNEIELERHGDIYTCNECKSDFYTDRWNILHRGKYFKKYEVKQWRM